METLLQNIRSTTLTCDRKEDGLQTRGRRFALEFLEGRQHESLGTVVRIFMYSIPANDIRAKLSDW